MAGDTKLSLNQVLADPGKLARLYTRIVSLRHLLGATASQNIVLCPFHEDHTPSAKIHSDPDGERLWCFTCQKMFNSYHYVKIVLEENPRVWIQKKFTREQLESLTTQVDFADLQKQPLDISEPLKTLHETKNVSLFLDQVYALVAQSMAKQDIVV